MRFAGLVLPGIEADSCGHKSQAQLSLTTSLHQVKNTSSNMANPAKGSKGKGGKGGGSPSKSNKFTPKKFGSPIRTKKVWGNYINVHQTTVPWLVIGIPIRSNKHMCPWMKPIIEFLERDNGELRVMLNVALVADRKGSTNEEGKYQPIKRVMSLTPFISSDLSCTKRRKLCRVLNWGKTWLMSSQTK